MDGAPSRVSIGLSRDPRRPPTSGRSVADTPRPGQPVDRDALAKLDGGPGPGRRTSSRRRSWPAGGRRPLCRTLGPRPSHVHGAKNLQISPTPSGGSSPRPEGSGTAADVANRPTSSPERSDLLPVNNPGPEGAERANSSQMQPLEREAGVGGMAMQPNYRAATSPRRLLHRSFRPQRGRELERPPPQARSSDRQEKTGPTGTGPDHAC